MPLRPTTAPDAFRVLLRVAGAALGLLVASAVPAHAAPGTANKVAVLPIEIVGEVPASRTALEAAIMKGLVVAAVPVLIGPDVGTTLTQKGARVACTDATCWSAAGKALGVRHLVTGEVERKGTLFQVEFRLIDAAAGRVVLSENNSCEVADCSVAELCRLTVHELARVGITRTGATTTTGATATDATAGGKAADPTAGKPDATPTSTGGNDWSGSAPPPTGPDLTASAPPAASSWSWPSWFPIASIATGLAAGGAGAYLISIDGKSACGGDPKIECPQKMRTFWGGVATAGVGAALLATGIVVGLVDGGGDAQARAPRGLIIGPGSIGYVGRF